MTPTDPALIARVEALFLKTSAGREISQNWIDLADLRAMLARIRELESAAETEREAGRREERERIARRLEEEADLSPCQENANVYRGAATLVRADFSYDGAEEYEDKLDAAERRIRELEAERDAARAILTDKGQLSMTAEERLSAWLDGYRDNDQIPVDLFHDIKRARDALRSLASAPAEGGG